MLNSGASSCAKTRYASATSDLPSTCSSGAPLTVASEKRIVRLISDLFVQLLNENAPTRGEDWFDVKPEGRA